MIGFGLTVEEGWQRWAVELTDDDGQCSRSYGGRSDM